MALIDIGITIKLDVVSVPELFLDQISHLNFIRTFGYRDRGGIRTTVQFGYRDPRPCSEYRDPLGYRDRSVCSDMAEA